MPKKQVNKTYFDNFFEFVKILFLFVVIWKSADLRSLARLARAILNMAADIFYRGLIRL